ncbi:methyltransferase domain-containing protein [Viridibacterium curvum]|uniref:Methyltransferase domain-containing protein n=1 Tax=Viridibacterium curvum TaxID=1101404 RepID=A0ABP9QD93_9RHOO
MTPAVSTQDEKRAIREAFGRAANQYDSVARVQRAVADALLARVALHEGLALDAGAGTGYLCRALRQRGQACLALDHAAPMLLGTQQAICADIEHLPIASATLLLYASSLAWQWIRPAQAIAEAARVLQKGGQLQVATLGPQTLAELREAYRQADAHDHVRHFDAADLYAPLLQAAGFADVRVESQRFQVHAASLRAGLRELRTLGAHVVSGNRPRGLSGVRGFRRAEAWYEALREEDGLPFTYDVVFLSARLENHAC